MFEDLKANEIMKQLMWRRLGYKRLFSDEQFEGAVINAINYQSTKLGNTKTISELQKLKKYLACFYYLSGPCVESRLYKIISNYLSRPENAIQLDDGAPIIYVYRNKYGAIPVARRENLLPEIVTSSEEEVVNEAIVAKKCETHDESKRSLTLV